MDLFENTAGRVHYINFEQHKLYVKDQHNNTVYINMNNIIGVTYNDWLLTIST